MVSAKVVICRDLFLLEQSNFYTSFIFSMPSATSKVKKITLFTLPLVGGVLSGYAAEADDILGRVVTEVFAPLYALVASIAFLYFLYGVLQFILSMNDPEKKNIGKQHLLYGTIGLFIILSVGGMLQFFNSVFGGMFEF